MNIGVGPEPRREDAHEQRRRQQDTRARGELHEPAVHDNRRSDGREHGEQPEADVSDIESLEPTHGGRGQRLDPERVNFS